MHEVSRSFSQTSLLKPNPASLPITCACYCEPRCFTQTLSPGLGFSSLSSRAIFISHPHNDLCRCSLRNGGLKTRPNTKTSQTQLPLSERGSEGASVPADCWLSSDWLACMTHNDWAGPKEHFQGIKQGRSLHSPRTKASFFSSHVSGWCWMKC